jgi:multiple sugar transport system permease protein
MVPSFLNIIPQFIILKGIRIPGTDMNLIGTRVGLILVYVATNVCGHTLFLRNFFRSLPDALSESVIVDGGGHGAIFFRVMLPLSKPAIGTMSIFALQGFWEEYFTAKVLVGANESMMTLPLLLQRLLGQYATRWEWVFAASILALIPIVILFILFQKKLVIGGSRRGPSKSNNVKIDRFPRNPVKEILPYGYNHAQRGVLPSRPRAIHHWRTGSAAAEPGVIVSGNRIRASV